MSSPEPMSKMIQDLLRVRGYKSLEERFQKPSLLSTTSLRAEDIFLAVIEDLPRHQISRKRPFSLVSCRRSSFPVKVFLR